MDEEMVESKNKSKAGGELNENEDEKGCGKILMLWPRAI